MGRVDQHIFEDIYRQYSGKLYGVCLHYVQDKETANDLLHDSFIIIFSSLDQVKDMSKLESWMKTIVKNIALNHLRSRNRVQNISIDEISEPVYEMEIEENPHPEITFDQILPLVDALPERYGKVFRLSVLEGLSHDEIGVLLGIGAHSSSSNLSRAKALLRKAIMKHYGIVLMICSLILISIPLFIGNKNEDPKAITLTKDVRKIDDAKSEIRIPVELPSPAGFMMESRMAANEPVITDTSITDTSVVIKQHLADTIKTEMPKKEVQDKSYEERPFLFVEPEKRKKTGKGSVLFAVSGGGSSTSDAFSITATYPGGDYTASPDIVEKKTEYIHSMPVTLSATFRWNFNRKWAMNTGLRYTYLSTKIYEKTIKNSFGIGDMNRKQQIHYIGIPLNASYSFWCSPKWNAYVSAGAVMEFPVAASIDGVKMNAPFMWAAEAGLGMQYDITDHLGIYVDCNIQYFFNTGSEIRNAWIDRPLGVSIPIGIRYTW